MIDQYREMIESAMSYGGGTHTFEDVRELVAIGKAQLWPGKTSVGVTEIIQFPRKKTLNCWLAAGDLDELLVMMQCAKEWGAAQGCDTMTMSGRMGWQRVLNKHGWRPVLVTMETPI
jgi:hypothetical protein